MAIESQWFRVRAVDSPFPDIPHQPEYSDRVLGFASFQLRESPVLAMRAFAEPDVLDGIASEPRATEITASEALNAFRNESPTEAEIASESELNESFRVTVGENYQ